MPKLGKGLVGRLKIDAADLWVFDSHYVTHCSDRSKEWVRATCKQTRRNTRLSRVLLNAPEHLVVDHINRDPFDNRRSNLRLCTKAQNAWNQITKAGSSPFKGVQYTRGKWHAIIRADGARRHIGCFASEEEAACAYDREARARHSQFARLNFPIAGELSALADATTDFPLFHEVIND